MSIEPFQTPANSPLPEDTWWSTREWWMKALIVSIVWLVVVIGIGAAFNATIPASDDARSTKLGEATGRLAGIGFGIIWGWFFYARAARQGNRWNGTHLRLHPFMLYAIVAAAAIGVAAGILSAAAGRAASAKQVADAVNRTCPRQLDDHTRMDSVTTSGTHGLVYHYTMTGIDEDAMRTNRAAMQADAAARLHQSEFAKDLAGYDVTYVYANAAGEVLARVTVHM